MADALAAPLSFRHSQYAFYCTALCGAAVFLYDSTQSIVLKYHITKKWLNLCGAMMLFAWLYVRPLIRRRLGSASGGYINWSSIYVLWLCAAVFYHFPSLESMGVDVKADISMLLLCFLLSAIVIGALSALHSAAVALRVLSPRLLRRAGGARRAFTTAFLNSFSLAAACSTYYAFCGNAVTGGADGADSLRAEICGKWLHPLAALRHPAFSRWVIYGEPAVNDTVHGYEFTAVQTCKGLHSNDINTTSLSPSCSAVGASATSLLPTVAAQAISPVFTAWLTLFAMLVANWVADYAAAGEFSAAYSSEAKRAEKKLRRRSTARTLSRRHITEETSTDFARGHGATFPVDPGSKESLLSAHSMAEARQARPPIKALLQHVSSLGSFLQRTSASGTPLGSVGRVASFFFSGDGEFNRADEGQDDSMGRLPRIYGVENATPVPASVLADPDLAAGIGLPVHPTAPSPAFLPMFAWFSGTSADLLKTLFDLLVSVKLFLGRFDMRTMQAATAATSGCGGWGASPRDGDGFVYEHLAHKEEAWVDFCGDTGDGGDPTYSVARCMAARQVTVELPAPPISSSGTGFNGDEVSDSHAAPPGSPASNLRVLPRADVFVHGGDLAYPNPTDETYEQRLFSPYEDAFPPPSHVHPGHLVVNKPDLPEEYWIAGQAAEVATRHGAAQRAGMCSSWCQPSGVCNQCAMHASVSGVNNDLSGPCRACAKAAALTAYDGPTAFMIPGNHDWIDGLETFQRHVAHKGWLGGWLLPQEKSYFALHLPQGWWLFAIDLGLNEDIDMMQFAYFARIAEERMGPDDAAILVTHCPEWLTSWFWGHSGGKTLRKLVRGPLRGRARLHLAGDLHFYMRHSFRPYTHAGAGSSSAGGIAGISPPLSEMSTPAGLSPVGGSPTASRCATPPPFLAPAPGQLHQSLVHRLHGLSVGGGHRGAHAAAIGNAPSVASRVTLQRSSTHAGASPRMDGSSPAGWSEDEAPPLSTLLDSRNDTATALQTADPLTELAAPPPSLSLPSKNPSASLFSASSVAKPIPNGSSRSELPPASSPPATASHVVTQTPSPLGTSPPQGWWAGLRISTPRLGGSSPGGSVLGEKLAAGSRRPSNGGGCGAGTGNTDASAGEWEAPPPGYRLNEPEHLVVVGTGGAFLHPTHVFAYSRFRPVYDPAAGPVFASSTPQGEKGARFLGGGEYRRPTTLSPSASLRQVPSSSSLYSLSRKDARRHAGGEFRCAASFPSPEDSLRLGRLNLHTFRHVNNRFDVIGGALYYLLVISVMPRCSGISEILDAHSVTQGARLFVGAATDTVVEIFSQSYVSLTALAFLFIIVFGFARSGGVGAISGEFFS
jgi:hypothetical protein